MDIVHNMIKVIFNGESLGESNYSLYWADNDGNNMKHICNAYGFENAIRIANGIAYNQVEYVQSPPFDKCG